MSHPISAIGCAVDACFANTDYKVALADIAVEIMKGFMASPVVGDQDGRHER